MPQGNDHNPERELLAALRRTEAGFREFIDRCPDAIFVRRGSAIIHANRALLQLLGVELLEIVGRDPVTAFVHPDNRKEVLDHREQRSEDTDLREHRWVRKGGEPVMVEIVGVTVDFEGAPARVVMCRDVTERKKLQARLMVTGQLAAIGTLAAGIAHEINNPLSAATANLRLIAAELRKEQSDRGELPEVLADALAGMERVRRIVAGLGTFARSEGGQREELELPAIVDAAVELASGMIRDRARVVREYRGVARVNANRGELAQLVVNLLINAAQAIPQGHPDRHEIRVETRPEGQEKVVLSIRDTGAGISPEVLPRIFDPFFSTRSIGEGLGLGLSIAHNIVTLLGGEISVESRLGAGTTITILLPAAPAPPE